MSSSASSDSQQRAARLERRARRGPAPPSPTDSTGEAKPREPADKIASADTCFAVLENVALAAEIAISADAASVGRLGACSKRAYAASLGACAQLARRRHGVALPEAQWTVPFVEARLAAGQARDDDSPETPLELLRFLESRDGAAGRRGACFAAFSARHGVFVDDRGGAFACGRAEDGRCGLLADALGRCEAGGQGALLSPTPLKIDSAAAFERDDDDDAAAAAAPEDARKRVRRGSPASPALPPAPTFGTWGPTPAATPQAPRRAPGGAPLPPRLPGSTVYSVRDDERSYAGYSPERPYATRARLSAPRREPGAPRSPARKRRARRRATVEVALEDTVVGVAAGAGHSIVLSALGVASCCGRGAPRSPAVAALNFDGESGESSDDDGDSSDSEAERAPRPSTRSQRRTGRPRGGRSPSAARSVRSASSAGSRLGRVVAQSPAPLGLGLKTRVVVVSASANHALFVTAAGRALSSGVGAFGRLGHGDEADAPSPRYVRGLRHARVVAAAAGAAHSLFATASGVAYACGQGEDGRLGLGAPVEDDEEEDDDDSDSSASSAPDARRRRRRGRGRAPRPPAPKRAKPSASALPRGRTADRAGDVLTPQAVVLGEGHAGAAVRDVVAGAHHSIFLTVGGAVLSCGHNASGQLGHAKQRTFAPEVVPFPARTAAGPGGAPAVAHAAAGYAHSLFVDEAGVAYACGSNARGALGLGDHVDSAYRATRTPPERSAAGRALGLVARVAAGGASSALKAESGAVYVFGANTDGQLGLGHFSDVYAPTARPTLPSA